MMIQRKAYISSRHARSTRRAFTLVEILVALAVLMLMLTIILVPINMGLSMFHIGKARAEVQQANQLVVNQLAAELKRAVHVFPNEEMPGITNKAPYTSNDQKPYYDQTITVAADREVSNTARLDFLLPAVNELSGSILTPPRSNNYIVTYYARRLKPKMADNVTDNPYNAFTNPVVLWRAQYPYKEDTGGSAYATPPANLANMANDRYSDWTLPRNAWLTQTKGEPNLESFTDNHPLATAKSTGHTLIAPRDMALILADKANNPPLSLQPDSSFTCDDVDGDGKIDRVTMSLLLEKYDTIGAEGDKSQQIRATQTVALPNIK